MKITKEQLRTIIEEEIALLREGVNEADVPLDQRMPMGTGMTDEELEPGDVMVLEGEFQITMSRPGSWGAKIPMKGAEQKYMLTLNVPDGVGIVHSGQLTQDQFKSGQFEIDINGLKDDMDPAHLPVGDPRK